MCAHAHGSVQGQSSARVVVLVGVQRDGVYACVCMHEHGRVHQGLCTRPFVLSHFCVPVDGVRTYSCARMHLHVCVNAQVCVRRSLCTWVYGSAHFCAHRCACKGAAEAPGNRRFLGAAQLLPECWRAQGREAQLRSTALCTTACRTARSADRTRTQRHSRHCKGNSSIPAGAVTGRQALGRAARQRDALCVPHQENLERCL